METEGTCTQKNRPSKAMETEGTCTQINRKSKAMEIDGACTQNVDQHARCLFNFRSITTLAVKFTDMAASVLNMDVNCNKTKFSVEV